ncbi:MAG: YegS/Rv2252/BmrU family lipid kinase [Chloroflexi bacterium]|nr:YegS/Rv2252/BmrU family lipid kinase [Chloroflexota bacterium]
MAVMKSLKNLTQKKRRLKAKLIFNSAAGNPQQSADQLTQLLDHLQVTNIHPDVFLVHPEYDLSAVARQAVNEGYRFIIVSGGDGTIESVACGLVGTRATLGIVPTGTRNNLARGLGIPSNNVAEAVAILRAGERIRVDVGHVQNHDSSRFFLEAASVGLVSALFPSADEIQHGDLGKITEFISTFVSHTPAEIHLRLDDSRQEIITQAHMVLIANMPYMGGNFQIAPDISFDDRQLDVFVYSNLSKLDLIGHAVQVTTAATDQRVDRYKAKRISITTNPAMPVLADGVLLKEGQVSVTVRSHALSVMANPAQPTHSVAPVLDQTAEEAIVLNPRS